MPRTKHLEFVLDCPWEVAVLAFESKFSNVLDVPKLHDMCLHSFDQPAEGVTTWVRLGRFEISSRLIVRLVGSNSMVLSSNITIDRPRAVLRSEGANESFRNRLTMRDVSTFRRHPDDPNKTLVQVEATVGLRLGVFSWFAGAIERAALHQGVTTTNNGRALERRIAARLIDAMQRYGIEVTPALPDGGGDATSTDMTAAAADGAAARRRYPLTLAEVHAARVMRGELARGTVTTDAVFGPVCTEDADGDDAARPSMANDGGGDATTGVVKTMSTTDERCSVVRFTRADAPAGPQSWMGWAERLGVWDAGNDRAARVYAAMMPLSLSPEPSTFAAAAKAKARAAAAAAAEKVRVAAVAAAAAAAAADAARAHSHARTQGPVAASPAGSGAAAASDLPVSPLSVLLTDLTQAWSRPRPVHEARAVQALFQAHAAGLRTWQALPLPAPRLGARAVAAAGGGGGGGGGGAAVRGVVVAPPWRQSLAVRWLGHAACTMASFE